MVKTWIRVPSCTPFIIKGGFLEFESVLFLRGKVKSTVLKDFIMFGGK